MRTVLEKGESQQRVSESSQSPLSQSPFSSLPWSTSLLGDYSLTGGASFSPLPFLSQSTEILPPWR